MGSTLNSISQVGRHIRNEPSDGLGQVVCGSTAPLAGFLRGRGCACEHAATEVFARRGRFHAGSHKLLVESVI
jgi:hypothetical protein